MDGEGERRAASGPDVHGLASLNAVQTSVVAMLTLLVRRCRHTRAERVAHVLADARTVR